VHYSPTYIGWRVDVPAGPIGRRRVNFRSKKKAELFLRAAKRELKKVRKVSFLTSPHRLLDALEALKLLEKTDGPWWNKLRRAAALYVLCCEEERARTPEKPEEGRVRQMCCNTFLSLCCLPTYVALDS
jgi:hypothetical protein